MAEAIDKQLMGLYITGNGFDGVRRILLFDNVYWREDHRSYTTKAGFEHITKVGYKYTHHCGSRGGRYRIAKKGTCYKCKKMIASYEKLDTIRGLKELTEKEDEVHPLHFNPKDFKLNIDSPLPYP